jgi:hypothetical protein
MCFATHYMFVYLHRVYNNLGLNFHLMWLDVVKVESINSLRPHDAWNQHFIDLVDINNSICGYPQWSNCWYP